MTAAEKCRNLSFRIFNVFSVYSAAAEAPDLFVLAHVAPCPVELSWTLGLRREHYRRSRWVTPEH
jgi:hypothetical protein